MSAFAPTTIAVQKTVERRNLAFWLRKIWALLWLIRFIPSGAATLAFLAGLRLSNTTLNTEGISLGLISTFLVTSGCSAWNDYWDQKEDAVNVPYRPLPSGVLPVGVALSYSAIAFTITALLTFTMGVKAFVFYGTATLASLVYSPLIKPLPVAKTAFVALFCASLIIFGGYVGGNTGATIEAAMIVIVSVAAREILIDIHDMHGDKLVGHKTLPLIVGVTISRNVVSMLLCVTVLLQVRFMLFSALYYLPTLSLLGSMLCFLSVSVAVAGGSALSKSRLLILIRLLMVGVFLGLISAILRQSSA